MNPVLLLLILFTANNSNPISAFKTGPNSSPSTVKRRIIGGRLVKKINNYPYMAYLEMRSEARENSSNCRENIEICGATILNPTHILTAAHCMMNCNCIQNENDDYFRSCMIYGPEDLTLYIGSTTPIDAPEERAVKRVHVHPEHKYADDRYKCLHRFDIAVLVLAERLYFDRTISKVNLPKPVALNQSDLPETEVSKYIKNKTKCKILGWGNTKPTDDTKYLHEELKVADVLLIEIENCRKDLQISLNLGKGRSVCSGTSVCSSSPRYKNTICHGDSGGPIICEGIQVGVTSWGVSGCEGPHNPSVFTRVDVSLKWINQIISRKTKRKTNLKRSNV